MNDSIIRGTKKRMLYENQRKVKIWAHNFKIMYMETRTVIRPEEVYRRVTVTHPVKKPEMKKRWVEKLKYWVDEQNLSENRFKWVGTSMIVESVIITPLVALVIMQTGNHPVFWVFCTAAMYLTFIPGLSGLSVKTLLRTFFASIIVSLTTIVAAVGVYIFS
jgi:hypothetical protein